MAKPATSEEQAFADQLQTNLVDVWHGSEVGHLLDVPILGSIDVSNAVAWLVSDEA